MEEYGTAWQVIDDNIEHKKMGFLCRITKARIPALIMFNTHYFITYYVRLTS